MERFFVGPTATFAPVFPFAVTAAPHLARVAGILAVINFAVSFIRACFLPYSRLSLHTHTHTHADADAEADAGVHVTTASTG
jgi:hypothetical protein